VGSGVQDWFYVVYGKDGRKGGVRCGRQDRLATFSIKARGRDYRIVARNLQCL
jgi:hypothetical protein